MSVDEPRHEHRPARIDHPRAAMSPALHLGVGADRDDPLSLDGERAGGRMSGIEREDAGVDEDRVRGYVIHP